MIHFGDGNFKKMLAMRPPHIYMQLMSDDEHEPLEPLEHVGHVYESTDFAWLIDKLTQPG